MDISGGGSGRPEPIDGSTVLTVDPELAEWLDPDVAERVEGRSLGGFMSEPVKSIARIDGKRVALLVEEEYEDRELCGSLEALRAAGATVMLVGPTAGREFSGRRRESKVISDLSAGLVSINDFDALIIPGGHAPDKMRLRHAMVDLARDALRKGKVVAAICHGPQVLISADVVRGRTLTCWPSIAIDVKNAGGLYVDKPVVQDGNLITSRKPDDVPLFSEAIIEALGKQLTVDS